MNRVEPARAPRWTRADTAVLTALTLAAAVLRFAGLGSPGRIVFDEVYYAQDACRFVEPQSVCGIASPLSEEHPLLAKWILAGAIELFGYSPWAWRLVPAVLGTLAVALLFLLARRLRMSTAAAAVASGLLAVDFLHLALSRLAMLDVFVSTFALAGVLAAVIDRNRAPRATPERARDRPWLLVAGAALGAAVASKWSGIPFLGLTAAMVVVWDARRHGVGPREAVRRGWRPLVVALVVLPLVVYVASFGNRLDGALLALPWDRGSWWWDLARRQVHILSFHIGLDQPNFPYTSPAWSWLLVKRPVVLYLDTDGGSFRHMLAMGSPLVWWPAIAAIVLAAVRWVRGGRGPGDPEGVILAGLAAGYLPWLVLTIPRSFSFLFYLMPAVPFVSLAVARALELSWKRRSGRVASGAYLAAVLAAFVFFFPILTARPLSPDAWLSRMWFRDCRTTLLVGDPPRPSFRPGSPPEGWCWI
jgi:dolichyl-phosphate-mannose--protein O-mannosyl transferase